VIERARRYVAKCPPAISGQAGHDATFHVACVLVNGFALGEPEALALLREYNAGCQPPWSEPELVHKVASATSAQHKEPRGYLLGEQSGQCRMEKTALPRVAVNPVAVTEKYLDGFRCTELDLADASPVRSDGEWKYDGAVIIGALYQPGEQINFVTDFEPTPERNGKSKARPKGCGLTIERDQIVARFKENGTDSSEAGGWLRMNPLDGQGIADANVTAFRFALLESDTLPLDLQLSLFARLPLPVAAILSSGGCSYHAWVRVDAGGLDDYRQTVARLLGFVARFGVDGKNKNPSRLSRLPGAKRVIGAVGDGIQRLLYLNPQPEQRRILE
jgi:hypothetical protein